MNEPLLRERQVFDPDSIRDALELDLPSTLRALADAIEAKDIDGQFASVKATALAQHWRDIRMHILVTLDIAAQAYRWGPPLPTALLGRQASVSDRIASNGHASEAMLWSVQ